MEWLLTYSGELAYMRKAAQSEYQPKYTADRNDRTFVQIYECAIEAARSCR